jgi:hypothetical protein
MCQCEFFIRVSIFFPMIEIHIDIKSPFAEEADRPAEKDLERDI